MKTKTLLIESKIIDDQVITCYNNHPEFYNSQSDYNSQYMLVISKENNDIYAYFEDKEDMFYFYNLIK